MSKAGKFRKEREVSKEKRAGHLILCKILYMLYSNYSPILKILLNSNTSFCSLKNTIDKSNIYVTIWEKMFIVPMTDIRLISKIYKEFYNAKKGKQTGKGSNSKSNSQETQSLNNYVKKCSTLPVNRESQIKQ